MKIIGTTETGRVKSGYPVLFAKLSFEVAETPGAGGDFVALKVYDESDPNHAIELSFAEVEEISTFAADLRKGVLEALKAQTKVAKAKTEVEAEQVGNGAGEPEEGNEGDEGDEDGDETEHERSVEESGDERPSPATTVAAEGTKKRRATRRPRGAGPAAG